MQYKGVPLYEKDGKIGVLLHNRYGAGWSSDNVPEFAYDARIIEFWLEHKDDSKYLYRVAYGAELEIYVESPEHKEVTAFLRSLGYSGFINLIGINELSLMFVDKNEKFFILEHHGFEHIATLDEAMCFEE